MSKLIDRLRRISEASIQPMGFRLASTTSTPSMVLVGGLSPSNLTEVAKAIANNVDALAISWAAEERKASLSRIAKAAGDIPWGLWLETVTSEDLKNLREAGGDFLVFGASAMPAAALREQEMGKIVTIDPGLSDSFIRTLDQLPVDAVLLHRKEESPLLLSELMGYQRLINLVRKPLLLAISSSLAEDELACLWDTGVSGVILGGEHQGLAERLSELRRLIGNLPAAGRKRARKVSALLPALQTRPSPVEEEEEDT